MIVFIEELLFVHLQDDSEYSWPICRHTLSNYVTFVLLSFINGIRISVTVFTPFLLLSFLVVK